MLCRLLLVALLTKLFPPFAIASSPGVVQLIVLQSVYNASLSAVTEQSTDELDETLTYDINIFWWETILIQSKPFLYKIDIIDFLFATNIDNFLKFILIDL